MSQTEEVPLNAPARRPWVKGVAAAFVLAGILGALALLTSEPTAGERIERAPGRVLIEADGYRYVYHLVMDSESLFDLSTDPRCLNNLKHGRPELTERYRSLLIDRLGVGSLSDLREGERAQIERLRALGYL